MSRLLRLSTLMVICALLLLINNIFPQTIVGIPSVSAAPEVKSQVTTDQKESIRDAPPDTTPYVRGMVSEDFSPGGRRALAQSLFVRDVVVSNTDPNLTNSDTFNDGEPSIAVNPKLYAQPINGWRGHLVLEWEHERYHRG